MLQWLFPLALLALIVAIALAPGWVTGLLLIAVFGVLGYGVAWYYRRYHQFHNPDDHH